MQLADELLKSFAKITNDKQRSTDDSAKGTVVVQEGATFVQLDGSDALTPVETTAGTKNGDRVLVSIKNHKATILGNYTDPSAASSVISEIESDAATASAMATQAAESADSAQQSAGIAATAATEANASASTAANAATIAQSSATQAATNANSAAQSAQSAAGSAATAEGLARQANTYATSALDQLGVVQDVVGVLNWASSHGTFTKTLDETIQNGKVYFAKDAETDDYIPVITPDASQLSNYYELTVNEAMQSYIMAHLAVTNRGLWVLPSGINTGEVTPLSGETIDDARARLGSNYKVLLSNSGMTVYDDAGIAVATYGESIYFDSVRPQRIGGEDTYIEFYDSDDDGLADAIRILGSRVTLGGVKNLNDALDDLNLVSDAADTATDAIFGVSYFQYTVDGQTYDVSYDSDSQVYYYYDSNGDLQNVEFNDLDGEIVDENFQPFIVEKGGLIQDVDSITESFQQDINTLTDSVEKIEGSIDINTDDATISIRTIKKTSGDTEVGQAALNLASERLSFTRTGDDGDEIEVAYIDSQEEEGVLDINNARIHMSLRIGELEFFEYRGGIAVRRWMVLEEEGE